MSFRDFLIFVILGIILFVLFSLFKKKGKTLNGVEYSSKPLMTGNEIEFFGRLARALPEYHVFPQVALGAIVNGHINGQSTFQSRSFFSQKIADYVVCDRKMKVIAIIELDDKTHDVEKDQKRDLMLHYAGYKIIRWHSTRKPSTEQIRKTFGDL